MLIPFLSTFICTSVGYITISWQIPYVLSTGNHKNYLQAVFFRSKLLDLQRILHPKKSTEHDRYWPILKLFGDSWLVIYHIPFCIRIYIYICIYILYPIISSPHVFVFQTFTSGFSIRISWRRNSIFTSFFPVEGGIWKTTSSSSPSSCGPVQPE